MQWQQKAAQKWQDTGIKMRIKLQGVPKGMKRF